jgi:hypothetical protein
LPYSLTAFLGICKGAVFLPSSAPALKAFDIADKVSVNGAITMDIAVIALGTDIVAAVTTDPFPFSHHSAPPFTKTALTKHNINHIPVAHNKLNCHEKHKQSR